MDTMHMTRRITFLTLLAASAATFLASCTSVPTQLQGEFADISPARVQPDVFGSSVRWGGVLIDTRNEENKTCFEVLSRELDRYMRPVSGDDTTAGRFIACTQGFHDPEIYSKGREVTITGQIEGVEDRKIEEFDYSYPVLAMNDLVLWQKRKTVMMYDNFYNPYFYPYYWGGGPYWGYYPYYRYPGAGFGYGFGGGYAYPRELVPGPSQIITPQP